MAGRLPGLRPALPRSSHFPGLSQLRAESRDGAEPPDPQAGLRARDSAGGRQPPCPLRRAGLCLDREERGSSPMGAELGLGGCGRGARMSGTCSARGPRARSSQPAGRGRRWARGVSALLRHAPGHRGPWLTLWDTVPWSTAGTGGSRSESQAACPGCPSCSPPAPLGPALPVVSDWCDPAVAGAVVTVTVPRGVQGRGAGVGCRGTSRE